MGAMTATPPVTPDRAKALARFAVWLGEHRDEIDELVHGLSASVFAGDIARAKPVALQLDCGAVKASGVGARFGGAEGLRKYCRVETVVVPRTDVGGNYYHNSPKALNRMNRLMTRMALARPRRTAK